MALCGGLLRSFKHYLCCHSSTEEDTSKKQVNKVVLSPATKEAVLQVFRLIDVDESHSISLQETSQWWSSYSKVNTKAMFEAVDADGNGEISEDEWVEFWAQVVANGHSEEDIVEELSNIKERISWANLEYKNSA